MKTIIFVFLLSGFLGPLAYADDFGRYQYVVEDKLVFDTLTGQVYRFIREDGTIKHVNTNYVTGVIKVDGAIRASGTFDYRDMEEEVIISKVSS